jgi:hypothetical protein
LDRFLTRRFLTELAKMKARETGGTQPFQTGATAGPIGMRHVQLAMKKTFPTNLLI